jgi:hypothetical protein
MYTGASLLGHRFQFKIVSCHITLCCLKLSGNEHFKLIIDLIRGEEKWTNNGFLWYSHT